MSIENLHKTIQQAMPASVWSRGVSLARDRTVLLDLASDTELKLRIRIPGRTVSPQVTLWVGEGEWECNCGDRQDPCAHVAAGVVAVKNQWQVDPESPALVDPKKGPQKTKKLQYLLRRHDGAILFDRALLCGTTRENLTESLVAFLGGVQSGRHKGPTPAVTQTDFAIDGILGSPPRSMLRSEEFSVLLRCLSEHLNELELDGVKIQISSRGLPARAVVEEETHSDQGRGFRFRWKEDPEKSERFRNGVILINGVLASSPPPSTVLPREGIWFPKARAMELVEDWIPKIEATGARIEVLTDALPKARERIVLPPRARLRFENGEGGDLFVTAEIFYGDPPVAQLVDGNLVSDQPIPIIVRDLAKEREWSKRLQQELHLQPNRSLRLTPDEVPPFLESARGWEMEGSAKDRVQKLGQLTPHFQPLEDDFELGFFWDGAGGERRTADPRQVLGAWRSGRSWVPLIEGGFGELPQDWLTRYAERIEALFLSKDGKGKLPSYAIPLLGEIAGEEGKPAPKSVSKIQEALGDFDGIPECKLPADLQADLRTYQRKGIDWLFYLKSLGTGALLADDMGLGKTLQALAAIEKRALVVAPTSVLQAWLDQAAKFRPGLKVQKYAGTNRKLDMDADVIVTSYGILRVDQEKLTAQEWEYAILDEAQTIKNPDSQGARAAFRIRAKFKMALTGTPIENRLEDLWSQFQFLSPGLLGTRDSFVKRTQAGGTQVLRTRIKPFILRRLKKDVAPELPPRTEVTLHCELGPDEREVYRALLGSAKKEVMTKLREGGGVLAALELLLRLRQTCAHPALVPGQSKFFPTERASSKIELFLEHIKSSIDQGHRALVFSQWTSFLDIIEPFLKSEGIAWTRLDGSTKNRAEVVAGFQSPDGPPVMLLSLKAGGVGLTLTAADHVYLLDPWWNPAVENQAADRAHRIGQENPVLIHRIVAENTVEDRIIKLQEKKRELARSALGEGEVQAEAITRADLLALLEDLK